MGTLCRYYRFLYRYTTMGRSTCCCCKFSTAILVFVSFCLILPAIPLKFLFCLPATAVPYTCVSAFLPVITTSPAWDRHLPTPLLPAGRYLDTVSLPLHLPLPRVPAARLYTCRCVPPVPPLGGRGCTVTYRSGPGAGCLATFTPAAACLHSPLPPASNTGPAGYRSSFRPFCRLIPFSPITSAGLLPAVLGWARCLPGQGYLRTGAVQVLPPWFVTVTSCLRCHSDNWEKATICCLYIHLGGGQAWVPSTRLGG